MSWSTNPTNADGDDLHEPLFESAPLAHAAARALCRSDDDDGAGCAWYHGSWQYFRALGIVTAPTVHASALVAALRSVASGHAHPRVLVSGAADYSLVAHALHAYRSVGAHLEATVVDRCETPCHLSRWYAERASAVVSTQAADIFDYRAEGPYDVVFTHSFLGNFDSGERPRLLRRWRELLRPGGRAITVQRMRPGYDQRFVAFSAEQATAFRDAVHERAVALATHLDQTPEYLAALAFAYAERVRSYPVRSADELRRSFEEGGFEVEKFERVMTPAPSGPRVSGPALPSGAEHVEIVAVRR